MSEIAVKFTGFKNLAQAQAFVSWYGNSGEQDASEDFECRKEEGLLDVSFMSSGPSHSEVLPDGTTEIIVPLTMQE